MDNFQFSPFCGPRLLTEDGIPGSSLHGRVPSSLKNSELKFWLQCRGDTCKGMSTKAKLVKRYFRKSFTTFVSSVIYDKN